MEILILLLLGGVWAAFLLPSFLASRRRAPINTTRSFARSQDLLASVSGVNAAEVKARRRAASRRRRVVAVLSGGALASLALSVVQSSFLWLVVTIGFDLALAGYVTLMLQMRSTKSRTATVVSLVPVEAPEDAQHHTVRVVAG